MKRSLSLSLVLILITFGLPTNSYAATDGCPDTWSIDYAAEIAARKAGGIHNQGLRTAKSKYGPVSYTHLTLPTSDLV